MSKLKTNDEKVFAAISKELNRERYTLEMIASENFTSNNILNVVGSILTNKYAEGYPGKRYYGGCDAVDEIENIAIERGKRLFNCDYVNVQPHSGSQANMAVFFTLLKPGDTVMGLNLAHGGHLTHGSQVNFSGKLYNFVSYSVDNDQFLPWTITIAEGIIFLGLILANRSEIAGLSQWHNSQEMFKRHLNYGRRGFLGSTLLDLNTRLDIILLGLISGTRSVGVYSIASLFAEGLYQAAMVPRYNFDPVVTSLFIQNKFDELQATITKAKQRIYLVAIPSA